MAIDGHILAMHTTCSDGIKQYTVELNRETKGVPTDLDDNFRPWIVVHRKHRRGYGWFPATQSH